MRPVVLGIQEAGVLRSLYLRRGIVPEFHSEKGLRVLFKIEVGIVPYRLQGSGVADLWGILL